MPVLKNARHELFAQEIAKGKSLTDAYAAAGYKPDRGNACTLANSVEVKERVQQLTAAIAKQVPFSAEMALKELDEARDMAVKTGQSSVLVAATMGKAKIAGLITDKQRIEEHVIQDRAALERAVIDAMAANTAPVAPKPTNSDGETLQ